MTANKKEAKKFEIETGKTIPPKKYTSKYDFPFLLLEKGQSFLISRVERSALRAAIYKFAKSNPEDSRYWTTRLIGQNEYRCWRVS